MDLKTIFEKAVYLFLLNLLLIGCATHTAEKTPEKFYPDPPALPRIQFLTSYTGASDIEEDSSMFDKFVLGSKDPMRRLFKPYGVAVNDGKIYVCDSNLTVTIFNLKEKKYEFLQGAKGMGKVVQPINIFIDEKGEKYVADPIRGQVVVYDSKDYYLKAYGRASKWKPVAAVPFENYVYVVDSDNAKIQVFDKTSGQKVKVIGQSENVKENLGLPTNLSIDKDGNLYVSDSGRFQVLKYDRDGHFLEAFGRVGDNPGHFARPRGVAIDRNGYVYVVDAAFNNVQLFHPSGQLLMAFGGSGREPGNLELPAGIVIDYDNVDYFKKYAAPNFEIEYLIIVISQFGDHAVNVYGFGKEKGKEYPTFEERVKQLKEELQRMIEDEATTGAGTEKKK